MLLTPSRADETNGTKRLECYDRFFTPKFDKHKAGGQDAPEDKGNWSVNIKISPVDDSQNVFVSLDANESFAALFGERVRPTLYVYCDFVADSINGLRSEGEISLGEYLKDCQENGIEPYEREDVHSPLPRVIWGT